jgi:hypothetical protein
MLKNKNKIPINYKDQLTILNFCILKYKSLL